LELSATPQVESGSKSVPFKNVIYNYPLSAAMTDGFVKEPAVATRENFDPKAYSTEGLKKVEMEDSVRIHENTKVELEMSCCECGVMGVLDGDQAWFVPIAALPELESGKSFTIETAAGPVRIASTAAGVQVLESLVDVQTTQSLAIYGDT